MSCGTKCTERSWRDSTISALEKIASVGEEGKGDEGLNGLQISSPVQRTFVHLDGSGFSGREGDRGGEVGWEHEAIFGLAT